MLHTFTLQITLSIHLDTITCPPTAPYAKVVSLDTGSYEDYLSCL